MAVLSLLRGSRSRGRALGRRGQAAGPAKGSSEESLADQVRAQYDSAAAMEFYRVVMGGGDGNIHYGLNFLPPGQESVAQASQNTVDFMGDLMKVAMRGNLGADTKVMDLGSGHGGAAHSNIQRFACHVTGFNLGAQQNAHAEAVAEKLGIADKFTTRVGNFDEDGLPVEWTGSFDAVWSEEVFCHSMDKPKLLGEVHRVLRPGGALVFSDIMAGQDASADDLRTFTDRNATSVMYRPSDYLEALKGEQFTLQAYVDFTEHLAPFLQGMVDNIDAKLPELKKSGVSEEYALNFRTSLTDRIGACDRGCFAWGAFAATKRAQTGANPLLRSGGARSGGSGVSSHGISGRTFSTRSAAADNEGFRVAHGPAPESATAPKGAVVIVGAGHVGTFLATSASASRDVQRRVMLKLGPEGLSRDVGRLCDMHEVEVVTDVPRDAPVDLAFLATKTFSHAAAADDLVTSLGDRPEKLVVAMVHNGYARVPPALRGRADVVSCVTLGGYSFGADAAGQPTMQVKNGDAPWLVAPASGSDAVINFFAESGLRAESDAAFELRKLRKFLVNGSANLLAVARDCNCDELVARHGAELEGLFDEIYDVLSREESLASALAIAPPKAELRAATVGAIASYGPHFPSTKMDFDAGNPLEMDSLNGFVLDVAAAHGVAAPRHTALVEEVTQLLQARDLSQSVGILRMARDLWSRYI